MKDLLADLEQRRRDHLYRERRTVVGPIGPEIDVDGRRCLAFCSNDYLGLAADPRVVEAAQNGLKRYGLGAGAAHLVTGHSAAHEALEDALADFTGRQRALLFSTGYMANQGVISALVQRADQVFEDRLNHASLIDGGLLSGARFRRYPHADVAALRGLLLNKVTGDKLVVTDGVFSMDGDLAPLPELAQCCTAAGAWLMVDDAHGFGVLGEQGRGSLAHFDLGVAEVPVVVGTLGKALGTFGAFVAGDEILIETLIQRARSYIYTTAPPPALAEATLVSLQLTREEEWRREHLRALVARFRHEAEAQGYQLMPSATPIQPILAGSPERALAWSSRLIDEHILVTAIRPPTVPDGSARLRVTFSALHTQSHLDRLLDALAHIRRDEA